MRSRHTDVGRDRRALLKAAIAAGILVLICVTAQAGIFGGKSSGGDAGSVSYAEETAKKTENAIEDAFPELAGSSGSADSLTKDETTYVIMDADGAEQEIAVNEWLRNPEKLDTIKDYSTLKDIRNTQGEEQFEKDGKKLTWASKGNDIRYSGTTGADLPVSVEVSYYLNGDYVTADEIAGQSGDVEIHFDYGVNARDRVVIGGSGYDLTHPYIMASGVLLDNDKFTDIQVSNGRVINEAGKAVCLGIALPGLQADLAISHDMIDIPESVVIKARTSDFKITGTYTLALTGLLKDFDTSTGDVTSKLDELESAFGKLSKASSALVKGSRKVADGAEKLTDGTDQLTDGTSVLKKGSNKLSAGVSKLVKGSKQLASGSDQVKNGAKKAEEGADKLSSGMQEITSHSEELSEGTDTLEENVFDNATQLLQANLIAAGMPEEEAKLFTLAPSTYKLVLETLAKAAPEHAEEFKAAEDRLDALEEYIDGVKSYIGAVDEAASGADELSSKMGELTDGAKAVDDGAESIYGGLSELSGNIPTLKKGVNKIVSGASKIDSGAGKLASGSDELADNMKKFDKQGIKKLVSSLDTTQIADTLDRFDAIAKASANKHFVGGTPKEIAGDARIIFKTGAVE